MSKSVTHFPEIIEPVLNQISSGGKNTRNVPAPFDSVPLDDIDSSLLEGIQPEIPDISEVECVRHFTRLSRLNFGIDHGMYPLGSCTMKYNPKICEKIAARIQTIHPADSSCMQPILASLHTLENCLKEVCGMDACTLWPAAGAHGELTGMMIIKQALKARGLERDKVLIPDTAHGTNPSSCAIAGFKTQNIPSGADGYLTAGSLKEHLDENVAGLMITNPNTLGIFEHEIGEIAEVLHENGSYLYMDGANMNAIMGIARPGDMGVDCMHVNLHKTFGTPHGGGGPGSGPVLVKHELEKYLPLPRIRQEKDGNFSLKWNIPESIGTIHSTLGNLSVLIKALIYILSLGPEGLRHASTTACINANYLKARLSGIFDLPFATPTLHEFVLSDKLQKQQNITTMEMAKALMDLGFHPPTIYFPLVVPGAIMVEPTETESFDELERFALAMETIAEQVRSDPDSLRHKPEGTPVEHVDEVWAARNLVLTWMMDESNT